MPPNPRNLKTGQQLGRYVIKKLLGRGAVASVYLAEDTALGMRVALKALHADKEAAGSDAADRMKREIALARQLAHPGICQLYDMHEEEGMLFLTMAYIRGRTLEQVIEKEGRLAPGRAARIMREVCNAMAEAHGLGILHRDLKPSNIMLGSDGAPVILDFGYATGPDVARLTATGVWVGTLQYVAPEQLKNEKATTSADVYSLGVTLYRCLTGKFPFQGVTFGEIASSVLYRDPIPPSEHVPNLDPSFEAVVLKAMKREARDRYASVAELEAALAEQELDEEEATDPAAFVAEPDLEPTSGGEPSGSTTEKAVLLATVLVSRPAGSGWFTDDRVPIQDRVSLRERFILPELEKWRGTLITSGRAGLAAWFAIADDAVRAGMAIQRAAERYRVTLHSRAPASLIRIGVHTGLARFEGRDVTGDVVDMATHISDWASAGEIVATEQTIRALGEKLATLGRRAGAHRFVGGEAPLELYQIAWQDSARTRMAANPHGDEGSVAGASSAREPPAATPPTVEPPPPVVGAVQRIEEPSPPVVGAAPAEAADATARQTVEEEAPGAIRARHAALARELADARREKGLIAGDRLGVDSLERTATLELSRGQWKDAAECLRLAVDEVNALAIDQAFVAAKIQRLDEAMRAAGAYAELTRLQPLLDAVMTAFERGDFAAANRALNRAFEAVAAPGS